MERHPWQSYCRGMSLALAISDGKIKVDDPACKYIPEWENDPQNQRLQYVSWPPTVPGSRMRNSLRRILLMLKQRDSDKDRHMDIPGWKGNFWRKDPDPFTMARDMAPVIFTPGTAFHYSNPGMAMLSYGITASYRGTQYKMSVHFFAKDLSTIGMNDSEWSIGYGQTYNVNDLELVANWGGGSFTPRAVARIGRLMLNNGKWDGKQLLMRKL